VIQRRIFLCGGDETPVPDTSDCPNNAEHTPMPRGYSDWHAYASRLHRTRHRQVKCRECGLYAIWLPTPVTEAGAR